MSEGMSAQEVGQEIAKNDVLAIPPEREVRREVPAGEMHMRAGLKQRVRDGRESLPAVDQHVDLVARPHRWAAGRPAAARRVERALPADPPEPPPVVSADLLADLRSKPALGREQQLCDPIVSAQILR